MGKHVTEISLRQAEKIAFVSADLVERFVRIRLMKWLCVFQVIFFHQLAFTISYNFLFITILALYIRIFPNRWLQKASLYLEVFVTVYCWMNIIIIIFQCRPTAFFWDKTIPGGHCIHQSLVYFINSTILTVMTLTIIFLPVPVLWGLQMPLGKRIRAILAFIVGAL